MLKEVENNFVDFLSSEFLVKEKRLSKKNTTKKTKRQGATLKADKDLLLLDALLKEKHRKVLAKMKQIEDLLDKNLQKPQNKKIKDIEEDLIAEWQKEFVKLEQEILSAVPKSKKFFYSKKLKEHFKRAMSNPAHLYPFIFPKDKTLEVSYVQKNGFAYHLLVATFFALIFALSITTVFPQSAQKMLSFEKKFLVYLNQKAEHIFYSPKNLKDFEKDNSKFKNNNLTFLSKKELLNYIIKNSQNISPNTVLKLRAEDIKGRVAGALEINELAIKSENKNNSLPRKKCWEFIWEKLSKKIFKKEGGEY